MLYCLLYTMIKCLGCCVLLISSSNIIFMLVRLDNIIYNDLTEFDLKAHCAPALVTDRLIKK